MAVDVRAAISTGTGSAADAGFASVDAMVALVVLAMSTALGLSALHQAHRVATRADETHRAQTLLTQVLEAGPRSFATSSGLRDGFAWRLDTTTTGTEQFIDVCRRAASVRLGEGGRIYRAATLETCPQTPGS